MATITIPKNLIKEKDLILIPRSQYKNLLRSFKSRPLKFYSKSDAIYEEKDTGQAVATYKKEKKQGKLKVLKSPTNLAVASESSLSKDWLKKTEEKAWQNL